MRDFGAILARAKKQAVKSGGNSGTGGNNDQVLRQNNDLAAPAPVSTTAAMAATVDTDQPEHVRHQANVSTAARYSKALDARGHPKIFELSQRLTNSVATVSTVSDEISDAKETTSDPGKVIDVDNIVSQRCSDLMADGGRQFPPASLPSAVPLIPPEKVRAGFEREMCRLAARGQTGPEARRDAIAITRAKIRNSPHLAEYQIDTNRCLICDEAECWEHPFIAVLSGNPGRHNWLHTCCHSEHMRRQAAKVDDVMRAAGFDVEQERGTA